MLKSNPLASRNSEAGRHEAGAKPLGSRQIQTATTKPMDSKGGHAKRGLHVNQSIEGSSTAASGMNQTQQNFSSNRVHMPRRPLSTDQTITANNQEYPVAQRIPLTNKLQNRNNNRADVSPQINLQYSGLTREEIAGLSVDEIYSRMANNLARND